jgi:hypothetical protein
VVKRKTVSNSKDSEFWRRAKTASAKAPKKLKAEALKSSWRSVIRFPDFCPKNAPEKKGLGQEKETSWPTA